VTAGATQTGVWQKAIDRMPTALQAGPYFVLGRALARQERFDEAALAMLRAPILYPRDDALASEALVEAGLMLEKLQRPKQAARLYREVLRDHPSARAATEARARWEAMTEHDQENPRPTKADEPPNGP
ncbi:MAG: hypothetical protein JW888_07725, partial [Pirellulales bacterium]|nr:hypothetical protein [Pirellulales bacterium]